MWIWLVIEMMRGNNIRSCIGRESLKREKNHEFVSKFGNWNYMDY